MSRRGRRGTSGHAEEEHVDERWLVSYADMITVLMCLFLVLFAMSTVDAAKYELLKNSLATGFGSEESDTVDVAQGVVVPKDLIDEEGAGFTPERAAAGEVVPEEEAAGEISPVEAAVQQVEAFAELRQQITEGLESKGLAGTVEYQLDERGLTVRLASSATFFESNSTTLSAAAIAVLDTVGPILAGSPYTVSVEGHADERSATFPFPTNWELSSGRSTQVLRQMVESGGVAGDRISAVGFGSERPLIEGTTAEELASNRRVDIVALSNAPDAVRALMPEIAAASS